MSQKPSVGRIVHYVSYGSPNGEFKPEHRAAVVTQIHPGETDPQGNVTPVDNAVKVCVLNPTGIFFSEWLYEDPTGTIGGSWHWPEFVK